MRTTEAILQELAKAHQEWFDLRFKLEAELDEARRAEQPPPTARNACGGMWHHSQDDHRLFCWNCGSMSVADLITALKTSGTRYSGSDWKYGWPHKFYIEIPNPNADELVEIGSESGGGINKDTPGAVFDSYAGGYKVPQMGRRSHINGKFYTDHLKDAGPEQFAEAAALLLKYLKIDFKRGDDGRIKYRAPSTNSPFGFQADGVVDGAAE